MKVQLIFAPSVEKIQYGDLGVQVSPPLGILYIAGWLRKHRPGIELDLIDGLQQGYARTLAKVERFIPDIVGISFYTPVALSAFNLADDIKALLPGLLVILGGPHATALPEEVLARSSADVVAIGEGEQTMLELVDQFDVVEKNLGKMDFEKIAGLAFRNGSTVKRSPARAFIPDLDEIPFPARDLLNMKDYSGWFVHKKLPETKMLMSRGCPYNCTFCDAVIWKSAKPWVRLRSPRNIVDEIEWMHRQFGINEVMDDSDEFNNEVDHAEAICDEMIRRGLSIPWKTQLRAWPLTERLVRKMAEAGCWYVHLGIESGNPETLKGIRKKITIDQVINACRLLRRYDIKVLGLFMLYNVWEENDRLCFEDLDATKRTLRFAKQLISENLLDFIGWSVTTPYPGSDLYKFALKYDLIKPELLGQWDAWIRQDTFVMRMPGLKERDMVRMKTIGQLLRGYLILKSGRFGLKDIPFFFQKGLKLLINEIKTRQSRYQETSKTN